MKSMKKILIIDDEEIIRKAVKRVLQESIPEIEVIETDSADQVLDIAQNQKPDLILLDVLMPGVNGLQLLKDLKNINDLKIKNIPVVIMTGIGNKQIYYKAKNLGAADYITKPFDDKILILKLKKYLM